jgi:hypothetical protein
VQGDHLLIGIAAVALCALCGWVSGLHRTTVAAEVTWAVTIIAVIAVDVALWRGRTGRPTSWHVEAATEPWPRHGSGGSAPALVGVAPWLALTAVALAWGVLGIDTGPRRYHLTISARRVGFRRLPPLRPLRGRGRS